MRYSMSLNSHWIQKYQPSKLNDQKKPSVSSLKRTFFSIVQLWRLVFLVPVGVQRHTVPHFKGLIKLDWNQKRPRAWQHFYPLPRPLETGHFTPITAKCPRTNVPNCIRYISLLLFFWTSAVLASQFLFSAQKFSKYMHQFKSAIVAILKWHKFLW